MRLLLILRRLTDIQSELVLYWKLSAGSGGLWDKNRQGKMLRVFCFSATFAPGPFL